MDGKSRKKPQLRCQIFSLFCELEIVTKVYVLHTIRHVCTSPFPREFSEKTRNSELVAPRSLLAARCPKKLPKSRAWEPENRPKIDENRPKSCSRRASGTGQRAPCDGHRATDDVQRASGSSLVARCPRVLPGVRQSPQGPGPVY